MPLAILTLISNSKDLPLNHTLDGSFPHFIHLVPRNLLHIVALHIYLCQLTLNRYMFRVIFFTDNNQLRCTALENVTLFILYVSTCGGVQVPWDVRGSQRAT